MDQLSATLDSSAQEESRMGVQALPVLVDEVPDYEARGDRIVVRLRHIELHIPVEICRKAMGRCNRALDEWHERKERCA